MKKLFLIGIVLVGLLFLGCTQSSPASPQEAKLEYTPNTFQITCPQYNSTHPPSQCPVLFQIKNIGDKPVYGMIGDFESSASGQPIFTNPDFIISEQSNGIALNPGADANVIALISPRETTSPSTYSVRIPIQVFNNVSNNTNPDAHPANNYLTGTVIVT